MKKEWEHSVMVDAPVDQVFALVADASRHPEWDKFTKRVELAKEGDAAGVGAEWKVYEQLGLFTLDDEKLASSRLTGLAKRVVRELVPNKRVAWHTHPVPNVGISADLSYDFVEQGNSTRVTFEAVVSVPVVLEQVRRAVLRNLDDRQHGQWVASLEKLKAVAEEAYAREQIVPVAV
jgi:uncharacterized membrane protein